MKIKILKTIGNLKQGEKRTLEDNFAKNLIKLKFAEIYKEEQKKRQLKAKKEDE